MALGSLATATNVSPIPTARAPTPMRRNVADDVPARCPPSVTCAPASPHAHSTPSASSAPPGSLEVHIELEPPLAAGAVVGRIVHLAHAHVVVDVGHVRRVVLARAEDAAAAGDPVHAVVDVVVEDVRALEAQVEAGVPEPEPVIDLEVGRDLDRRVPRVRQADGVDVVDLVRRVRAARLALHVDVEAAALRPEQPVRRLVVEPQVEVGGELARAVPAHELLGDAGLVAPADLLERALLVGIAALAAGRLVGV